MGLRKPRSRTTTQSRLDTIARGLADGMSRRDALRLGGAAVVGMAGLMPSEAWAVTCPRGRVRCAGKCCPAGEVCLPPSRPGGTKHCGCPHHLTRCGGRCVNLHTNVHDCGACGHQCPSGATCTNGRCVCPSGQTACSGRCVSLSNNAQHCGTCGNACPQGQTCSGGRCQAACPSGETNCSGSCVNLKSDASNCGACGHACPSDQVCQSGSCVSCGSGLTACSGACVNLQTDFNNCGACGAPCSNYFAQSSCVAGQCHIDSCSPNWINCSGDPRDGCNCLGTTCNGNQCA